VPQVVPLDLADERSARDVLTVQRAAYAVEAALIGFDGIPPLTEALEALVASARDETFLGCYDGHRLVGVVSYRRLPDATVDICRLAVAPVSFRRGVGGSLLSAVVDAAGTAGVVVSTGSANTPALALYRRAGFRATGTTAIAPGVTTTQLERRPPSQPRQPPQPRCEPPAGRM
jgi:ribosomal protein S18 acetylase RimI-like enzyme